VRHVHLSNFSGQEHRRPEEGHLRLDRFLVRLAADGYRGAVSLELSPDALNAGRPDDEVAGLMTASLAYCRQAAAPSFQLSATPAPTAGTVSAH
jgi:sugar phosphate isomerase/epimerase